MAVRSFRQQFKQFSNRYSFFFFFALTVSDAHTTTDDNGNNKIWYMYVWPAAQISNGLVQIFRSIHFHQISLSINHPIFFYSSYVFFSLHLLNINCLVLPQLLCYFFFSLSLSMNIVYCMHFYRYFFHTYIFHFQLEIPLAYPFFSRFGP